MTAPNATLADFTPFLHALTAALLAYDDAVDELNRLRTLEAAAQQALLDKRAVVFRDGLVGTNDAARSAYLAEQTADEAKEVARLTSLRTIATSLVEVAQARLSVEKIRVRAIVTLAQHAEGDE